MKERGLREVDYDINNEQVRYACIGFRVGYNDMPYVGYKCALLIIIQSVSTEILNFGILKKA